MPPTPPHRRPSRRRHRPGVESCEIRCLLSTMSLEGALGAPLPASSPAGSSSSSTPFDQIIGASAVRTTYGVTGQGMTAAVIDTGVEYTQAALGGGFGNGYVVKAGYDLAEGDTDPMSTGWPHGTAVSGLIAGRDATNPGVAPGADLVELRVFGNDGRGKFEWIADALQYVVDHHTELGISVVNLSLSDGKNYAAGETPASFVVEQIRGLIDRLEALRIPVVSAAGNSYTGQQGMGFTAILPDTISVSGTDANDVIVSDAQRLSAAAGGNAATDLVAPGSNLMAPGPGGTYTSVTGTSFAAPLVTGSILLLQQIYQSRFGELPTVDQVSGWLRDGADSIFDTATGSSFRRLDVAGAAALVPAATPAKPTTPTTPTPQEPPANPPEAPAPTVAPAPSPSNDPPASPTSPSSDSPTDAPASAPSSPPPIASEPSPSPAPPSASSPGNESAEPATPPATPDIVPQAPTASTDTPVAAPATGDTATGDPRPAPITPPVASDPAPATPTPPEIAPAPVVRAPATEPQAAPTVVSAPVIDTISVATSQAWPVAPTATSARALSSRRVRVDRLVRLSNLRVMAEKRRFAAALSRVIPTADRSPAD